MALVPGGKAKKRVSFRVSQELWEEYQLVKKTAAEKGYVFDPTRELTEALQRTLEKAKEELGLLGSGKASREERLREALEKAREELDAGKKD